MTYLDMPYAEAKALYEQERAAERSRRHEEAREARKAEREALKAQKAAQKAEAKAVRSVEVRKAAQERAKAMRGPNHPAVYRMVRDSRTGRVRGEHCVVMEGMLGRPLVKGEEVHHKNLHRSDNRPENLELWVGSQPKGMRVSDLVEYLRATGWTVEPPTSC